MRYLGRQSQVTICLIVVVIILSVTLAGTDAFRWAMGRVGLAIGVVGFVPLVAPCTCRRRVYHALNMNLQQTVARVAEQAAAHQPPCRLWLEGGDEQPPGCWDSTPRIDFVVEV